jgi:hypothetical protein
VKKSRLAIVAVGQAYIDAANYIIANYGDEWSIHVLTDHPEKIRGNCEIEYHQHKVFSYFYKLLFVLRLVEKYKCGVTYVDADRLDMFSNDFLKEFSVGDNFKILNYWPEGKDFKNKYSYGPHFKPFVEYCHDNDLDYDIDTFSEEVFYAPYVEDIYDIIYNVEKIKPVFEYQSIVSRETNAYYPNIGNAEGLALSFVLKMKNLKIVKHGD